MKLQAPETPSMQVFERLESEVRSYSRSFPTIFQRAVNDRLWDVRGKAYIDFFAGAGALNYGHNNPKIKAALLRYIQNDGISHSLDMATEAKERFLERFERIILKPRGMEYKVMFPGPTGTNAVESALKIARKVTGRQTVMCFTNAFHGMSLGSLAVTGNKMKRGGAGIDLQGSVFMPYDGYFGENVDTVRYIRRFIEDGGSGIPLPAAVIVETVQGEGGLNAASIGWLKNLEKLCREKGMLLIVDDIQMGCGRTGTFFSFEKAGIRPDIVCLSKSIGGYGLPLALTLIRPECDIWSPGEHNGTFRGNNLGFVAASEALDYWKDASFEEAVARKAELIAARLRSILARHPQLNAEIRGRGLIQGIAFGHSGLAEQVCGEAFRRGLIMETSGPESEVMKIMPPLTVELQSLEEGLGVIEDSLRAATEKIPG